MLLFIPLMLMLLLLLPKISKELFDRLLFLHEREQQEKVLDDATVSLYSLFKNLTLSF